MRSVLALAVAAGLWTGPARAAPPPAGEEEQEDLEREVVVPPRRPAKTEPDRAGSVVTREEIEERLPRSAPDALRYEPGVYVQQTAHGQASPFVRGLTGQQTVILFDGIRLNTSTFRQGPNQYFFTVDSHTIQKLEVVRGSASTRYGSDALGGALITTPVEPSMDRGKRTVIVHPRAMVRTGTADHEVGGRAQLDLSYKGKLGVIGGVGYREVGRLRSGGRITEPATGQPQRVPPAFEDDGKTQKGTGFDELTADTRVVWDPGHKLRFTLGYYDYRQMNAPRTDKCPPPTAPEDECLRYLEQFRTLVYGAMDVRKGPRPAETVRFTLSFQNQHELRELQRGSPSQTEVNGRDDVYTVGTGLQLATKKFALAPWADLQVLYGADTYLDFIDSRAWLLFRDTDVVSFLSRGQYLDGSRYLTSGLWTQVQTTLWDTLRFRAGGRGAVADASADGDAESGTAAVDQTWVTGVGNAGVAAQAVPWLSFAFNVDQGFRAPNLDDLTSRQQTGPGFQFENPDLDPERSLTLELGSQVQHPWVELDAWVFQSFLRDVIAKAPVEQCPDNEPRCSASQTVFQLVNLDGRSVIRGVEGGVRVYLPADFGARATVAYAWGEGPNPSATGGPARVPLSRIPPLNGTAELGWRSSQWGFYTFGAVRWAAKQDRLALADVDDPRIPDGGTPGFAVVDLRAGYRWDPHVLVGVVFENVADSAYRYHGSSVNGPGRGFIVNLELGW